ncbi:hypothetical protein L9F63_023360, partial [Diploptera punctata]
TVGRDVRKYSSVPYSSNSGGCLGIINNLFSSSGSSRSMLTIEERITVVSARLHLVSYEQHLLEPMSRCSVFMA